MTMTLPFPSYEAFLARPDKSVNGYLDGEAESPNTGCTGCWQCTDCGKEIETQQNRAAASRWSGMTPEQRSREMKRVRKKGLGGAGGKKRRAKK